MLLNQLEFNSIIKSRINCNNEIIYVMILHRNWLILCVFERMQVTLWSADTETICNSATIKLVDQNIILRRSRLIDEQTQASVS